MTTGTASDVAVVLGPEATVIVPLADAVVEYFRLSAANKRSAEEDRVLAALTQSLGTLNHGSGADQLYEALKTDH